jgi:hypothetical protein
MTYRLITALARWRCTRCDTWNGKRDKRCIACG